MARPKKSTEVSKDSKIYVYSTLANDQRYIDWDHGGGDLPIEGQSVFVKGGTGVANDRLITPLGVATAITEEEAALLERNPVFKMHKDNGYVTIQRTGYTDPEKVAADMSLSDPSQPITPSSYKDEDQPHVGGE